jgi:SRSO17 transposase
MLDQMSGVWGLPKLPVVGDSGYGDATEFRLGLQQRGFEYVLEVDATASAYPHDAVPVTVAYSGRGRPSAPGYPGKPVSLRELALTAGRRALRQVTWRHGTKRSAGNPGAAMRSRFMAVRVRPANRNIARHDDGSLPDCWLIAEWPPGEPEPVKYWLSNMAAGTPLKTMVRLGKIRWRIEHDYRELKTGLGLDHFEGRSYTGWHRHVTLVVLAQAFCTLLRLDPEAGPKAAAPA